MGFVRRHPALSPLIVAAALTSLALAARGDEGAPVSPSATTPTGSTAGANPFGTLDLSIAPREGRSSDEERPAPAQPAPPSPGPDGGALPPEARSVAPAPRAAPTQQSAALATDPEQARTLTARARTAMANGDIAAARALLTAAGRDPEAERMLAEAWDPDVLARIGVVGIEGDAGKARDLYDRAAADSGRPASEQDESAPTKPQ